MGGLFRRLRKPRPPLRPLPLPAGACQFREMWLFAVAGPFPSGCQPDHHEGALRSNWFSPASIGEPMAFTLCHEHALVLVREQMMTGRPFVARS